jgi:hypothetical protein
MCYAIQGSGVLLSSWPPGGSVYWGTGHHVPGAWVTVDYGAWEDSPQGFVEEPENLGPPSWSVLHGT